MREEKVGILEKAHAKVSADVNVEWTKAEATQKEYLTLPAPSTPSALIRCWGRRRLSSMGEIGTWSYMRQ
jgi:hypothetical protein